MTAVRWARRAIAASWLTSTRGRPRSRQSFSIRGDDLVAGLLVQVASRLVGRQHLRFLDQCAGDRNTLLLAAGQLRGQVRGPVGEADAVQRGRHPAVAHGAGHAQWNQRRLDVLGRRQRGHQVKRLEDEPHLGRPHPGQLRVAHPPQVAAVQAHLAARRPVEPAEQVQQRRLAVPGPPLIATHSPSAIVRSQRRGWRAGSRWLPVRVRGFFCYVAIVHTGHCAHGLRGGVAIIEVVPGIEEDLGCYRGCRVTPASLPFAGVRGVVDAGSWGWWPCPAGGLPGLLVLWRARAGSGLWGTAVGQAAAGTARACRLSRAVAALMALSRLWLAAHRDSSASVMAPR